jgi:hypothetical protein
MDFRNNWPRKIRANIQIILALFVSEEANTALNVFYRPECWYNRQYGKTCPESSEFNKLDYFIYEVHGDEGIHALGEISLCVHALTVASLRFIGIIRKSYHAFLFWTKHICVNTVSVDYNGIAPTYRNPETSPLSNLQGHQTWEFAMRLRE